MITDDSDPEDTEEVTLNLTPGFFTGSRNIVILSPNETRVIIIDDDGKPIKNIECNTYYICPCFSHTVGYWISSRRVQHL